MTESEWLACEDPARMLAWLQEPLSANMRRLGAVPGIDVSDRKLRLFACACRRLRPYLGWEAGNGWEVMEADGQAIDQTEAIHDAFMFLNHKEDNPKQAALLRDIVGNPFRLVAWSPPRPLSGIGLAIRDMAQAAYDERDEQGHFDPTRLAVLADALEEAGCDNAELMRHLRFGQTVWDPALSGWRIVSNTHVRGCWALDLILGRE